MGNWKLGNGKKGSVKRKMGNEKWEIRNGKCEIGKWEMGNEKMG